MTTLRTAIRLFAATALLATFTGQCVAQNPQRGGGRGGRGGGRGRAIQVMTLSSTAFADGARIPVKYTQPGGDVSPPLAWTGVPDSAASFVLIVHDVDATSEGRGGGGLDDLLQWMVWNIPASTLSLAEGIQQGGQLPDGTRQISATGPYSRGPAAPATGPAHHYLFELYALDAQIDVAPVGAQPAATRAAVVAGMLGHIRAKATLVGTFKRQAP